MRPRSSMSASSSSTNSDVTGGLASASQWAIPPGLLYGAYWSCTPFTSGSAKFGCSWRNVIPGVARTFARRSGLSHDETRRVSGPCWPTRRCE
eukprot:7263899-Prymnesium_polylepis.1